MDAAGRPYSSFYLLLHLLLAHRQGACDNSRGPVICSTDVQVDLSNQNLTDVPSYLAENTQYLDLSYNNINRLLTGDLAWLPDLCVLKITHNGLWDISPSAFIGSIRIQILNVSNNALRKIPDLNLPDLRILDLSENLYTSYSLGESYQDLLSLNFLSLGSPEAKSINVDDFMPINQIPLKKLVLGSGVEMYHSEPGSFALLQALQELTLKMTFCKNPESFQNILEDLNSTHVESLTLVKFVPDICNVSSNISYGFINVGRLKNLTFQDTWFNSSVLTKVTCHVIQSAVKSLSFLNITFAEDTSDGVTIHSIPGYHKSGNVESLIFTTIHHYQYNFPKVNINSSFFSHLKRVKFSGTGMSIMPCNLISALPSLEVLDLSDNLLKCNGLWWPVCSYSQVFTALKRLYLRNNKFEDLQFIANHTYEMKRLESLDLSANSFTHIGKASWAPHVTELALSENSFSDSIFDQLSPYIETVNLTQNTITTLTQNSLSHLPALKRLFLSSNNINTLPPNLQALWLEELHVDQNNINALNQNTFNGLRGLKKLKAGNNPFACNCDIYWFVTVFNKSILLDWPSDYICSSPPHLAGTRLDQFHPHWVSCTTWFQIFISMLISLVVIAILGFGFYALDGAWYLQMFWVWMRVKRRRYKGASKMRETIFHYHAFISYSQLDSHWVESQLVANLEAAQFRLCVHERDFVPGDWIIDNIINCVEQSYKTLFVLSQNFVQSEWCNYELFFAQHRAISFKEDSLVFILLEPIPADSLPRKFLKLRTLLQKQTYLEWPKDEFKQQVFWASLRTMLRIADKNVVLRHVAREVTELCHLLRDTD